MGVGVRARSLMRATLLVVVTLLTLPLAARTKLQGYVEQGGQRHLNSAIFAITRGGATQTNPYSQQSYPNATVTVYVTGTLTTATLYSDPSGTAKSNPFTASSNAYWSFYVDDGIYDIRFSGGGITTPFTWSGITSSGDSFAVSVTGFGAVCDGTTDDTVAIQAAIDVLGGHVVQLPAGSCKITDQLLISQHGVKFQGVGTRASVLIYAPTVDNEAAIKVKLPTATIISDVSINNLWIQTANSTNLKIGIWIVDGSTTQVEDVLIGASSTWTGGASVAPFTGGGSIGIKIQGREFGLFRRVYIAADIPLYIGLNPNFATLDLDLHVFSNLDFHPIGDNPSIYIEEGANVTNVTVQQGVFVHGTYGVYWLDDTGGFGTSYNILFKELRAEQMTGSGGYVFYISVASGIQGITFRDIACGGVSQDVHGALLRGSNTYAVFDGYQYFGLRTCVDVDSTVVDLEWRGSQCISTSSTASLGTMVEVQRIGILTPMPRTGRWLTPNSVTNAGSRFRIQGVNDVRATGSLANGGSVSVPFGAGNIVTGFLTVSFSGATLDGAITCSVNSRGVRTLATTDATIAGCTGNVAGDFTVQWANIASLLIWNNLGETVTYNYHLNWN